MHFCLTGQYTPRALNAILENPTQSRYEAAKKLIEAAGGKLISMYSTPSDGPGVLTIFDVPDPGAAPAIVGIVVAAGTLQNVKLTRLLTQDEIIPVRQKAAQFAPPTARPASKEIGGSRQGCHRRCNPIPDIASAFALRASAAIIAVD